MIVARCKNYTCTNTCIFCSFVVWMNENISLRTKNKLSTFYTIKLYSLDILVFLAGSAIFWSLYGVLWLDIVDSRSFWTTHVFSIKCGIFLFLIGCVLKYIDTTIPCSRWRSCNMYIYCTWRKLLYIRKSPILSVNFHRISNVLIIEELNNIY